MAWAVKWHPKAYQILKKLPKEILQRVINKIDAVKEEPFRFLEHYEGKKVYKLRIGDYRALIDIDFQNKLLLIRIFDHRSRIYDRT